MPARLPDDKRAAILADIDAGLRCREIARKHGVACSTVSKLARENGDSNSFDRTRVKIATEAARVDAAARRSAIATRLLDVAERLLDQTTQPHLVHYFGGRDNTYAEHLLDQPTTGDIRNLLVSAGIALDKHRVLADMDRDPEGLAAVDTWLRGMLGGSTPT